MKITVLCTLNTQDNKKSTHAGETERSLKARFSEHRRPSSTTSEVSKHIHVDHPQHSVELENTEVLTTEPRWFKRGVKEALYIKALNSSLNRDGGRYNLPPVWDNIIKKKVKADRPRRGPRHHRLAQRPRQHHRDVLTDEADSRRRKLLQVDFLLSWVLSVQRTVIFQNQDRWVYTVICDENHSHNSWNL